MMARCSYPGCTAEEEMIPDFDSYLVPEGWVCWAVSTGMGTHMQFAVCTAHAAEGKRHRVRAQEWAAVRKQEELRACREWSETYNTLHPLPEWK